MPWGPLLFKIIKSDTHIFLDDVEFSKGDYQNRNYLYDFRQGRKLLITIPVKNKGNSITIMDKKISDNRWKKKHLRTLSQLYSHEPFFNEVFDICLEIIGNKYHSLGMLNMDFIKMISTYLDIECCFKRSSEFGITSVKTNKIVDLLNCTGADTYLTSKHGISEYLNLNLLYENDKSVEVIEYDFQIQEDYCSVISMLMRYGKETKHIIQKKGIIRKNE